MVDVGVAQEVVQRVQRVIPEEVDSVRVRGYLLMATSAKFPHFHATSLTSLPFSVCFSTIPSSAYVTNGSSLNLIWYEVYRSDTYLQGDHSGCVIPTVDIKTKVSF